jgi:hypothetical protein
MTTTPTHLPAAVRALPRHPHRYRLARAGIHQVWQYDEVFGFGGGRLLLRGKNGAGKSKALEMLLPFLLDGDPRRIDATGSGKITLRWLMLDGWTGGTNRLGYLWVEFIRAGADGPPERLTVGAAIKASTSTGEAKPLYFVTRLSAGDDLALPDPARRPSLERLRELVRPENCYDRAVDYRARVARELFGLADLSRYRNLIHLLYGLRRPTIGDRIEAGELAKVLTEALPPLDDEIIDEVARNLDDLDTVRTELARLERTDAALTTFLRSYRGYLRGVLRGRVGQVREALAELTRRRRAAGDAERQVQRLRAEDSAAADVVLGLERARDEATTDLRAIRDSAAYRALDDLRERRATVAAVQAAAAATWKTAELARGAERAAAGRLADEAEDVGRDLGELRRGLRDARRTARGCGLDEALLGEPPTPVAVGLAARRADTLTDVDDAACEVERPAAQALPATVAADLTGWRGQLREAESIAKARARAADALRARLGEVAAASVTADRLSHEAERLDGQLAGARARETDRGRDLLLAGVDYAGAVRRWAERLSDVDLGALVALAHLADEPDAPVPDRAADRDLPRAVREAGHQAMEPILARLEAERDETLAAERAVRAELDGAVREKRRWEEQTDPEPPRSGYATAARDPRTGAPLFLLVDFAEPEPGAGSGSGAGPGDGAGVGAAAGAVVEAERSGLEAALEASGLLNAWVCADGTLLHPDTRDVLLRPGEPVAGRSLGAVLRPAGPDGCPVRRQQVARLLAGVGLGESDAPSWVGLDGRWRLGVAHGAHRKPRAEYIGAAVRAATRARRIAELTDLVAQLADDLQQARDERAGIELRRAEFHAALRELPDGRALTAAWSAYDQAVAEAARLAGELTAARRAAEQARATAVKLRERAAAQATADGLPFEPDALATLRAELVRFRDATAALARDAGRVIERLDRHQRTRAGWEAAQADRADAERQYGTAREALATGRRELRRLEESVGATEQQILAAESDAERRLAAAASRLPAARAGQQEVHDAAVRADVERAAAIHALAGQEHATVAGGARLRRPLGLPGLAFAAELGEVDSALETFDATQDVGVRARIGALRALAEDVAARLGAISGDVGDSVILKRGEELRDGLAGGYDASIDETDGIKRFELHDDTGAHDVAVVGQRIKAAVADAQHQLSSREQEVFERYLLGELGDHLSRQVLAARGLVAAMNDTLDEVRSSHGIGARLVWQLPADADADVKAAADLLRQPSALRTREQSAQLRGALRRRIEDARLAAPTAGYGVHLRIALDYRSWFAFTVRVTDAAHPDRDRVLSHRTGLSQGEQRVVSYVVLFAAAAAHFSSIGRTTPYAPRLILLDDAFAKVDEPTHGSLLGLLVDLDLDFVFTSERLWGCFPTVPSLHIYECLRDPHVRGVATVHFTWDGHRKRLVSI